MRGLAVLGEAPGLLTSARAAVLRWIAAQQLDRRQASLIFVVLADWVEAIDLLVGALQIAVVGVGIVADCIHQHELNKIDD